MADKDSKYDMTTEEVEELFESLDLLVAHKQWWVVDLIFQDADLMMLEYSGNASIEPLYHPVSSDYSYQTHILRYTGKDRDNIPYWDILRDRTYDECVLSCGVEATNKLMMGLLRKEKMN